MLNIKYVNCNYFIYYVNNKIFWFFSDCEKRMTDSFIKNVIDLELIGQQATQKIDMLDCSSMTGEGFTDIVAWLQRLGSS